MLGLRFWMLSTADIVVIPMLCRATCIRPVGHGTGLPAAAAIGQFLRKGLFRKGCSAFHATHCVTSASTAQVIYKSLASLYGPAGSALRKVRAPILQPPKCSNGTIRRPRRSRPKSMEELRMSEHDPLKKKVSRRTVIKAAAAAGALQVGGPFIINARGEEPVKIGYDDPLTGTYAAVGKNELIGCQLAVEQMNAKGGILGRKVELLVEDSTSGEAAVAVQKANKLIERDKVDFLLGNINSALAQA